MSRSRQSAIGLTLAGGFALAWLALHFTGIFAVDLGTESWAVVTVIVLLQAWLSTALFITAHDAMHGALAPTLPRLQRFAGRAALMIYAGIDYDRMTPKHFAHHKAVGTGGDPDFNAENPRTFGPWLARFFMTYYTHSQLARITAVAAIYLLTGASLLNIVVFWAVPALLAMVQLFTFGTWLPHRHAEDAFADRHRARSNALPDWASLLTCFHFGGCHHEHHLHPSEPWWRLPERRREMRAASQAAAKAEATSASLRPNS